MDDDRVPLSPTRRLEKIVAQKSFEDLLEEAVVKKKKKKRKNSRKKTLGEVRIPGNRDESVFQGTSSQIHHQANEGLVNLAAEFSANEEDDERACQMPFPRLKQGALHQKVLAPIRPPRSFGKALLVTKDEPQDFAAKNDVTEVDGLIESDHGEVNLLDPTILNVDEQAKVSSPSSFNSRNSEKDLLLKSPEKRTETPSLSQSSPASLNSTPDKRPETKKRRRKFKRGGSENLQHIEMSPLKSGPNTRQREEQPSISEDQNTMLSVCLDACEVPLASMPAAGIFLRVHVVDAQSGNELQLSREQVVTSRSTGIVSKFRAKLALIEQTLTFEAPIRLALENDVVLLFEIFVPKVSRYSSCYARMSIDVQERCVGWAFLKLRSATGLYNTDVKLRLQIYEPLGLPKFTPSQNFKTVYGWWCKGPWKKTRCSIFVTVSGAQAADCGTIARKSSKGSNKNDTSLNDERTEKETQQNTSRSSLISTIQKLDPLLARGEGHLCKVTDKLSKSLSPPTFNCLSASFSKSGCFLAASSNQTIHIFKEPNFSLKCALEGHEGLIYSVSWFDDKWLVSASADCLALVWDVHAEAISKMLPHPSFVYCSNFMPDELNSIVTGGKDKTLRVWSQETEDSEYDLWQELDGHHGFVTAIRFASTKVFYSADSEGVVLSWTKNGSKHHDWVLQREFAVPDLKGVSLNAIEVHPNGKRIFVYARDSVVRMLDVLTGVVLQHYTGALSHKIQSGLCLSPCGSLLMAGSEDGSIVVWQADTGKVQTCISGEDFPPATALAYHPQAHILAVGYFGQNPVNIWTPGMNGLILDHAHLEKQGLSPGKYVGAQQSSADHLRLQDIIARIDRVIMASNSFKN